MILKMSLAIVALTVISTVAVVIVDGRNECPPWFEWVNSTSDSSGYCLCGVQISHLVKCDQKNQMSYIAIGSCAFHDIDKDIVTVAQCPFLFPEKVLENNEWFALPKNVSDLNIVLCGQLRREVKGPVCGRCINNTGPSIYSVGTECVDCSPVNIFYYLLLQYLPATLIVVVVLAFRLNVTAAPMAHYVIFCNIAVTYYRYLTLYGNIRGPSHTYTSELVNAVLALSAVWSLNPLLFISPPLCISEHMEEIYLPLLEFLEIIYPFILLLITYMAIELHAHNFRPVVALWRPFHRVCVKFYRSWDSSSTMIQAFSSLFFLS